MIRRSAFAALTLAMSMTIPAAADAQGRGQGPRFWMGAGTGIGAVGTRSVDFKGGMVHTPWASLGLRVAGNNGIEIGGQLSRGALADNNLRDPRPTGVDYEGVSVSYANVGSFSGDMAVSTLGVGAFRAGGRDETALAIVAALTNDLKKFGPGALAVGAQGWFMPNIRGTRMWSVGLTLGYRAHSAP
jgi:hypothetical protein